jgi:uncharacterized damage-inducible protein DinB
MTDSTQDQNPGDGAAPSPDATANEPSPPAPHARLAELLDELDAARRDLHAVVDALPAAVRDAGPQGSEWSVAQVLEHLARVEDGVGRLLTKLVRQARAAGAVETEGSSVRHTLDRFRVAEPLRRIEAPEMVQPSEGLNVESALERLTAVRARLRTGLVQEASGVALATVSAPHPAIGMLDGYQWILMVAQHERRHIGQIRRIAGEAA